MDVVSDVNQSGGKCGRGIVLGVAAALVLAAGSLHLEETGKVRLASVDLPTLCTFKAICGVPCPGCGLTRSFVATAHLDLARGFAFHPLGPLLFILVLVQLPWQAIRLAQGRRSTKTVSAVSAPAEGCTPVWLRLRSALLFEVLAIALVLVGIGRILVSLGSGGGPRGPGLALGSWQWALAILVLAGAVRLGFGVISARKRELKSFSRSLRWPLT